MTKQVGAAEFRNDCLQLLDQMAEGGEPVTITKRGQPVAVLMPIEHAPGRPLFGAMAGTVLRFDDPFAPAADADAWDAARE
jgi:prevent-host-death family protein